MQILKKRTMATAIATVILLLASAVGMLTLPVALAAAEVPIAGPLPAGATPTVTVTPVAHLSFRPTTVGLGQTFLVNLWLTPSVQASRNHPEYDVIITKPDGTSTTLKMPSYKADSTAWFEYVADQIGTWKLKFVFPGTYFPGGTAPGGFMEGSTVTLLSAYYSPTSTAEQTLTVQDNLVPPWPEDYMPTDYWTRPVHVENRQWWTIAGSWPATGYNGMGTAGWDTLYPGCNPYWTYQSYGMSSRLIPWVEGPDSAHILWKRQDNIAGLIGGQAGKYGYSGEPGAPSVIYAGRVYDSYTKPGLGSSTSASTMFRCYDLRTGQVYWEYPVTTTSSGGFFFGGSSGLIPNLIEYNAPTQSEVSGAEAAGTWSVNLIRIQSGYLYKWNPWTGAMTANISLSPISSATFYRQPTKRGEQPLALSFQDLGASAGAERYRMINWTTSGTSTNFTSRIKSNTTYARSGLPNMADFNSGLGAIVSGITQAGVYTGEIITGYDLWTGQMLWNTTLNEPMYSMLCDIADHGKIATLTAFGHYVCYDMRTGNKLWTSDKMDDPWSSAGFGGYTAFSAYGMILREAYDGIYAFNWTNGKMEWHYSAPAASAYETPYTNGNGTTVMPFYSFGVGGQIADGKFFTWNYEHTESWPVTRGWSLHAIDVFTGEGVWNLTGCATPRAIADGYLVATGWVDGYTYFIGKGKSATTVDGPKTSIALGQSVEITGTVLDQSPGQPGTPCVSKDSMKTQMDYLHMQLPIDGIWHNVTMTGVQVMLTAIDQNGNPTDIGTVTSEAYYGSFSKSWTPPAEGEYKIIASFAGDESYGSSGSSTAISVGPAPAQISIPEQIVPYDYTMTLIGGFLAVIIAVAIVGVLVVFRKK
jgi:PQQ-like domain